jgi:Zn-dependent M28 family amino/carboxypeptidase
VSRRAKPQARSVNKSPLWRSKALWGSLAAAAVVATLLAWNQWTASSAPLGGPIGNAAMQHTAALVAFGPRPVGSEAHQKTQQYIIEKLKAAGATVDEDTFAAQTPVGERTITNIIGRLGKPGGRIIVLASHYDTKLLDNFVGANDGGSSTGLLLALAPILNKKSFDHEIRLVFFDAEEAFNFDWSADDSVYGSKHLAAKWEADGTARQIGALILVDMIGDADLDLLKDSNSTSWLRDLVWKVAARLGYSKYFLNRDSSYDDDHIAFVNAGVPSVDLIDLNYGPNSSYWHTPKDTLDKLSGGSLEIVGNVVLESVNELDRRR